MDNQGIGATPVFIVMTVREVAEYLRFSEAKIYKMANDGLLPAVRMGKSWRFRKDLIDDWMRRETEAAFQSIV